MRTRGTEYNTYSVFPRTLTTQLNLQIRWLFGQKREDLELRRKQDKVSNDLYLFSFVSSGVLYRIEVLVGSIGMKQDG
jgi:hypothetical protein